MPLHKRSPSRTTALSLGLLVASLVTPHAALAQEPAPSEQAATSEPERTPPRVVSLPPIALPAGDLPSQVEALLTIGRDGIAQLAECTESAIICDAISASLIAAELEPARINGEPTAARVRVRFDVQARPETPPAPVVATPTPAPKAPAPKRALAPQQSDYGATARLQQTAPTAHALELAQMREVPGAFGDPFRAIEALPGVTPVISGLPYVYVRGAPPAATAYFYDDIQLPALFHLALGPAVVHAAMIGPVDFYAGVAPARYGRKTGGVVAGQAANRALRPGVHGELELRLIDLQSYIASPIGKRGRIEVGARYGYPGLVTKLIEPRSVVQYWDYQLRSTFPVSAATDVSLIVLGSYDMIGERRGRRLERDIELQFHRLELRSVTRKGDLRVGYAFAGGFERSGLGDEFEVQAARLGPKFWLENRIKAARLRVGADMMASVGKIVDPLGDSETTDTRFNDDTMMFEQRNIPATSHIRNPIYASAAGRNAIGMYTELTLPFADNWELAAGLRGDLWLTGHDAQKALEPRLLLTHHAHPLVTWHAAFGLAYQPAVFLLPLPGLADVALDRGLQRAIQSEVGTLIQLPASFSVDTKVYAHFYKDMLSLDALDEDDLDEDCNLELEDCRKTGEGFARMSAYSYGGELMLRRAFQERVSGWLAYTLSKADARSDRGRALTPSFDVRHVANLVFQWRITDKWHFALRGYGQSGRFPFGAEGEVDPRKKQRLPAFYRGDLQLSRIWKRKWGELRVSFDWLNFTLRSEPLGWDCSEGLECQVDYSEFPVTIPMLGLRGTY